MIAMIKTRMRRALQRSTFRSPAMVPQSTSAPTHKAWRRSSRTLSKMRRKSIGEATPVMHKLSGSAKGVVTDIIYFSYLVFFFDWVGGYEKKGGKNMHFF
jgi:hypothetical protein